MENKIFLLGVGINNTTYSEVLEFIIKGLKKSIKKYFIVTPNPEILMLANNDSEYKNTLNRAKLALPDGVGLILAGKILGKRFKERIVGVDLLERLCFDLSKQPITVGFLGGGPNVAVKTADCLREKCPKLKINFTEEEWNFEKKYPQTDILFVAFGSPKQELWIDKNLEKLPIKVAIGVGGAFDFISGKVKRAPVWMRKIGLEWLFRLVTQPWRIKRQVALIKFVFLVLREKLNLR